MEKGIKNGIASIPILTWTDVRGFCGKLID
jgi:hypothetical protein